MLNFKKNQICVGCKNTILYAFNKKHLYLSDKIYFTSVRTVDLITLHLVNSEDQLT